MNKILMQISKHMHEALENRLPEVRLSDLEDHGAVFYMNGKNGTAFDWYVNDHFPCFFIYYANEENLGAVKAILFTDGSLSVYVYGDNGHADPEEINYKIPADDGQLLNLAVLLMENADTKQIWDADIRKLACDGVPNDRSVETFLGLKIIHQPMIERRNMYGMTAIISKKIREGGWKIGYGMREEPTREGDSGWYFCVGDENNDYINDASNLELWTIGSILMYDQALGEFITAPYGTAIVRVDHDRFEIDEPGKEMRVEKRSR
ncbi:MAG: DUF2185 domain-containing protein [Clostridia bacterium]|nr:DUF2185 domain-containing protein [Clostridia bacterium]